MTDFNDQHVFKVAKNRTCSDCGALIRKGNLAVFWPSTGKLYCMDCGESSINHTLQLCDFQMKLYNKTL